MKNTRGKIAAIAAATLAISFLIGTGISDAMKLTHRGGGVQATAIRAKSFGGKSGHIAINRAAVKRAHVVNVLSSAKKRGHTLQRLPLLGGIGNVGDHFYGRDTLR